MVIVASLPGLNLFSSLPSTPRNDPTASSSSPSPPQPPIPIPKYPPPLKKSKNPQTTTPSPAFKLPHRRTNYYKPVKEGVVSSDGDRSVIVCENGVSYLLPGAPFDFQYSYSETPKVKPLAIREPAFLPFAPPTMPRPWTGKAPMKKSKKKIPLFDSFNSPPPDKEGMKCLEMPGPFPMRKFQVERRSREEILGKPLKRWEIKMLIKPLFSHNRQVNLGRDGLTHNMLELIHTHWRRSPVCKVRCLGVPTVDMDNVCHHLEERTCGKIVHKTGGVVYLFRGRNYDPLTRPRYPVMLWKPAAPVYPKLIQEAPEGLTKAEADELRKKGKDLLPICKLAKNGVYITLVADVRNAFEGSPLVKINCKGMNPSDYKKLGAKLKELVPCVLLSFDDEQILMWRGQNWKSIYPEVPSANIPTEEHVASGSEDSDELNDEDRRGENKIKEFEKNEKRRKANDHINSGEFDVDSTKPASVLSSSPKMMSLWKHAIESSKAILLDEIDLGADDLLRKVEEFEGISQVTEHSYPAVILSSEDDANNTLSAFEDGPLSVKFGEDDTDTDDEYEDDEYYDSDPFEERDTTVPLGSLPVDLIAEKLDQE